MKELPGQSIEHLWPVQLATKLSVPSGTRVYSLPELGLTQKYVKVEILPVSGREQPDAFVPIGLFPKVLGDIMGSETARGPGGDLVVGGSYNRRVLTLDIMDRVPHETAEQGLARYLTWAELFAVFPRLTRRSEEEFFRRLTR